MLPRARSFLRGLLRWRDVAQQVDDEWTFHLEAHIEDLTRAGLSDADARRRARRELGGAQRLKEDVRAARGLRTVDEWWHDAAYALRQTARSKAFTAVVVTTMALGIGVTTAIFTVVSAVLIQPLPYRAPGELVMVWSNNPRERLPFYPMSPAAFLDYQRAAGAVVHAEALNSFLNASILREQGVSERIATSSVTPGMFELLGTPARLGRTPGRTETDGVVLAHAFWLRRFGGDPRVVGRRLTIDDQVMTVTGVMPPDFEFPFKDMLGPSGFIAAAGPELWMIADPTSPASRFVDAAGRPVRGVHFLSVVARIRPGASLAQVQAEAQALAAAFEAGDPGNNRGLGATVVGLRERATGSARAPLLLLLAGVTLVLVIACLNVGGLLLGRNTARQKELAIRDALGASRARILRQLLTESVVLCGASGAIGLALAVAMVRLLVAIAPADLPRLAQVGADVRMLAVAFVISIGSGVAVGIVPALNAGRPRVQAALNEDGRGTTASPGRRRLRAGIVAGQLSLAVALTLTAGLLLRSFVAVLNVNPGFQTEQLLTLQLTLPSRVASADARRAFYRELFRRLEAVPGVTRVGGTTRLPLGSTNVTTRIEIEGRTEERPEVEFRRALHDYFPAMGIPVLGGRPFSAADDDGPAAEAPLLVNQAMARRYWPAGDAVGRRVRLGSGPGVPWARIVGIVGDVHHAGLETPPAPELYVSGLANPPVAPFVAIRTSDQPARIAEAVRTALRGLDPELAVFDMRTMTDVRAASMAGRRFIVTLVTLFGVIAVTLAAIGVYGLTALAVAERTPEFGLRLALGADRWSILKLALGGWLRVSTLSVALGLVAFAGAVPAIQGLLFDVGTTDLPTLVGAPAVLLAVGLLASIVPAALAARADPLVAIRGH